MKVRSLAGVLLLVAVGVAGAQNHPGATRETFPTGTTFPIDMYQLDGATAGAADAAKHAED